MTPMPTVDDADFRACSIDCRPRSRPVTEWRHTLGDGCAVPERDFWACSRDCWPRTSPRSAWRHTQMWGRCDKAGRPGDAPAPVYIQRVRRSAHDGPVVSWAPVQLAVFAPWVDSLSPHDQQEMLDEIADASPELRAGVVAAWQRTAEQLADPDRREVLLGPFNAADFVDAPRPGGPR